MQWEILNGKIGTAQVKDIKPGVLSKIMTLTEKDPSQVTDENLRKLMLSAKDIQESLLEYANAKPVKKVFVGKNETIQDSKTDAMKNLIERILEFK